MYHIFLEIQHLREEKKMFQLQLRNPETNHIETCVTDADENQLMQLNLRYMNNWWRRFGTMSNAVYTFSPVEFKKGEVMTLPPIWEKK